MSDDEGDRRNGFVQAARDIVAALGAARTIRVRTGPVGGEARAYEDEVVEILAGEGSSLQVRLKRNQNGGSNPVVMCDPLGWVYRFHGEYVQCLDHVMGLAESLGAR